jgi:tRNA(Ile)-lysidine synthase
MRLEERFIEHLKSLVPDAVHAHYLLTVSGGKDSTALAHLFHYHQLNFKIAHCNFHLRDEESDKDEQFVRELAAKMGKRLHVKQFYTLEAQQGSGKSVEMVAREERYEWFETLCPEADYIVTAHHADDNAETLLLNLARGTGLKGLTGIPARNGRILRPLLPFTSEEILQYLAENHIPFRTDQTNFSTQYHRNKIRHEIMPVLRDINPEITSTLCHNMAVLNQQYHFYLSEIQRNLSEIVIKKDDKLYISCKKLLATNYAELLLYEALKEYNFTASQVKDIIKNLGGISGKTFLSSTHIALKDRDFLIVKKRGEEEFPHTLCRKLAELVALGFEIEEFSMEQPPQFPAPKHTIYIDAYKMEFPVLVRAWEEGDTFVPFGMNGKQKVSDLFNNLKINRLKKKQIPILLIGDKVAWVVGIRADHRFRITTQTQHYYKITYHGTI